ncbi:protein LTO1 homolog isoform X1 [Nannospalax galili]|uniref:protein LTO1 homolog isoform X1 n=1 Tax=Nannospalax galili TaxID=1026970 RepID=UPI0004ED49D8|nr:protein LTO1 homolog isoform X1 [Nannospalax galili]
MVAQTVVFTGLLMDVTGWALFHPERPQGAQGQPVTLGLSAPAGVPRISHPLWEPPLVVALTLLSIFHGEGYREGYEEGSNLGISEGRHCGTLHGAKIGSEIGCYRGFALAWKCLLHSGTEEKDSRKMKVLETLIGLLQDFPYDDPTYKGLHEDLDRIRGKFRQLCSLLNVQPDFKIAAAGPAISF